ncbi:hypothetical protein CDG79_20645 [Nostoc sp. 'Peltigera membranacea cyanobiont' 232]|nr:hypothetical protein CDG79_20645 [Nostoc sp. 'Peltigera membranacea cyanobiont' 232]
MPLVLDQLGAFFKFFIHLDWEYVKRNNNNLTTPWGSGQLILLTDWMSMFGLLICICSEKSYIS